MTEQEIVNYLKENHNKGVAFGFMPKEVKEWCKIHPSNLFRFFTKYDGKENKNGMWKMISNKSYEMIADDIICLSDDYELLHKPKGEWVEFNIKDGIFYEAERGICYAWYEWSLFLIKNTKYTAFGGWQYDDDERWYLAPAVKLQDGKMWNSYVIEESGEATPVIPIKIRFWRESK